jgi:hypothetical protein
MKVMKPTNVIDQNVNTGLTEYRSVSDDNYGCKYKTTKRKILLKHNIDCKLYAKNIIIAKDRSLSIIINNLDEKTLIRLFSEYLLKDEKIQPNNKALEKSKYSEKRKFFDKYGYDYAKYSKYVSIKQNIATRDQGGIFNITIPNLMEEKFVLLAKEFF